MCYDCEADRFFQHGIESMLIEDLAEDERACSICWESYVDRSRANRTGADSAEDAVIIKTCRHVFGRRCLNIHVREGNKRNRRCPICRNFLFDFEDETEEESEEVGWDEEDDESIDEYNAEQYFAIVENETEEESEEVGWDEEDVDDIDDDNAERYFVDGNGIDEEAGDAESDGDTGDEQHSQEVNLQPIEQAGNMPIQQGHQITSQYQTVQDMVREFDSQSTLIRRLTWRLAEHEGKEGFPKINSQVIGNAIQTAMEGTDTTLADFVRWWHLNIGWF